MATPLQALIQSINKIAYKADSGEGSHTLFPQTSLGSSTLAFGSAPAGDLEALDTAWQLEIFIRIDPLDFHAEHHSASWPLIFGRWR